MGTQTIYSEIIKQNNQNTKDIDSFIGVRLRRNSQYIQSVVRKELGHQWRKTLPDSLKWILHTQDIIRIDFDESKIILYCSARQKGALGYSPPAHKDTKYSTY
jgi:hypothetical protein